MAIKTIIEVDKFRINMQELQWSANHIYIDIWIYCKTCNINWNRISVVTPNRGAKSDFRKLKELWCRNCKVQVEEDLIKRIKLRCHMKSLRDSGRVTIAIKTRFMSKKNIDKKLKDKNYTESSENIESQREEMISLS